MLLTFIISQICVQLFANFYLTDTGIPIYVEIDTVLWYNNKKYIWRYTGVVQFWYTVEGGE